ncbi:MAG: hypothetical protein Q4P18_07485 [Methanobrevibacter sp.]|uniref:hypothetical protein n=1 Tax=Methanobrevibacter sp. TaxID=66852 RepID=UPI0026DFF148|nr:hypothetical protein [Methanobrevibacter sp.]MDO5849360.1 hypothetical protein [Methanobrevibacter sp.]
MYYEILAVLFALSGFFMKFSDDAYDVSNNKQYAAIIGIFCAITSAIATVINVGAAYIFIGILIGNLIAFKVDGVHHVITLVLFIIFVIIGGIPSLSIAVLLICILSALTDEIGHEWVPKKISNKYVNLFFEYRFTMKVVIFLLAIFGAFSIWVFVCFLLFEIAYEFAGICYEKIH